ncbi:serine/threonine protein kinase [Streptomyces sp. 4F14]|uniref:serine/threonine protein kinase n=1 Tax=Streptomyces sp. 4F14 TaxID=3394380 RepID=UPI003A8B9E0E
MSDEGRLIAGRYRVLDRIGRGGMATVWRARDERLGRIVAVKQLHPQPHLDETDLATLYERTRREARNAARVSHPNVVVVHDVVDDEGRPVIVMEYVPSVTLAERIGTDGPLPPPQAARIGLGVLTALRAAHRAGVLHRDVKPANVLLAEDGRVVLTDFGIAQAVETPGLTRTGQLVGSVDFMAPERLVGAPPGPEADLWALGATLFQTVDGHSPFLRRSVTETMYAIAMEPPPEVRDAGPLTPLIRGLLAPKPTDRMTAEEAEGVLRAGGVYDAGAATGGSGTGAGGTALQGRAPFDAAPGGAVPSASAASGPVPSDPALSGQAPLDVTPSNPAFTASAYSGPAFPAPTSPAAPPKPLNATTDLQSPPPKRATKRRPLLLAVTAATAALATAAFLLTMSQEPEKATADPLPTTAPTAPPTPTTRLPSPTASPSSPTPPTSTPTPSASPPPKNNEQPPTRDKEVAAPTPTSPNTPGRPLKVAASGQCLSSGTGTEGLQLFQSPCDGSAAQRWQFTDGTARSAGKCMTVAGGSSEDRTEIQLSTCTGSTAQHFRLTGTQLIAGQSAKCVDIFGGASGTGAVLWECNGRDNQTWTTS